MTAATEADIQKAVIAYLRHLGAVVVRVNGGAAKSEGRYVRFNTASVGTCADLVGVYRGAFFAFEVKRPGGKPTDGQAAFIEAVTRAGGVAGVVTSTRDVDRLLGAA